MPARPGPADGRLGDPGAADAKIALRRRVRARRVARLPEQRVLGEALRSTGLGVTAVVQARRVAGYVALPGEPDPAPLLEALRAHGAEVVLPVLPAAAAAGHAGGVLGWAVHEGDLEPGPPLPSGRRIDQPTGTSRTDLTRVAVVLVPALAADTAGARLGQGGGWYDRTLADLRSRVGSGRRPLLVAVVHDDELHDAATDPLPVEPHDLRVDAVLTPGRWVVVG